MLLQSANGHEFITQNLTSDYVSTMMIWNNKTLNFFDISEYFNYLIVHLLL